MSRLGVVDAVEAHYLTLVLDGLHQAGVLRALVDKSADAETLADLLGLAPDLLAPLLDFAASRSDLLVKQAEGGFRLSGRSRSLIFVEHMLDQYVGGYGPPLAQLVSLLKDPSRGKELVNGRRHANAFASGAGNASASEAVRLILDLGATSIVDLGCGGGHLLCDAAAANPELQALGVDANPDAAAEARQQARGRGVDGRVEIVCGDALQALAGLDEDRRAGIQLAVASSMLNSLWASPGTLVEFLRKLARLLPGRILLVVDYYSHLARGDGPKAEARTLIHDVAQLVSGQGLPPPSFEGWLAAYVEAGAELLHRFHAKADGIDRFVHIIKLAD
jgi:SAM-dependent methyltransferase